MMIASHMLASKVLGKICARFKTHISRSTFFMASPLYMYLKSLDYEYNTNTNLIALTGGVREWCANIKWHVRHELYTLYSFNGRQQFGQVESLWRRPAGGNYGHRALRPTKGTIGWLHRGAHRSLCKKRNRISMHRSRGTGSTA